MGWLFVLLFLAITMFLNSNFYLLDENQTFQQIKSSFEKKEHFVLSELAKINNTPEIIFEKENYYTRLSEEEGIEFFVFKNDTPFIWTSSLIHPQKIKDAIASNNLYVETPSVKAVIIPHSLNSNTVGVIKLSENYSIQNRFIKNKNFLVSSHEITVYYLPYNEEFQGVYFSTKEPAFSFEIQKINQTSTFQKNIAAILFFLLLFIWIMFIKEIIAEININKQIFIWFSALLVSIIFWAIFLHAKRDIIFQTELFSPSVFAVFNGLSSLGEFLVLVILFSSFALIYPFNFNNFLNQLIALVYDFLIYSFAVLSIKWLIENSNLKFDFNNILNIDLNSILAIIALCVLFFSYLHFNKLYAFTVKFKVYAIIFFTVCSSIVLAIFDFPIHLILIFSFILPLIIQIIYQVSSNKSFNILIILALAISLFVSIGYFTGQKELFSKQFLAQKIAAENDPLAELLLKELKQNILKDKEIETYIFDNTSFNKSAIQRYLKEKYFGGYFDKYNLLVTPCFQNDSIIVQPGNKDYQCIDFFIEKIKTFGTPVNIDEGLFLLDYETGVGNYLLIIEKVYKDDFQQWHKYYLYIELTAKLIPEGSGYPELLLDNRFSKVSNYSNHYSFAKYKNQNLVLSGGNIKYSLKIPEWAKQTTTSKQIKLNEYNHFIVNTNDDETIIISSVNFGIIGQLTGISYLFGIFSLLFLCNSIYHTGIKNFFKKWKNFRTRIQILVAGTIAIATIIFGFATIYYQLRQYQQQNEKIIKEKLRSILSEIEQDIGEKEFINATDEDLLTYYLIKYSNVFFTDLNIYDTAGELLASSRKNIFEIGLSSPKINSYAYHQLNREGIAQFIHREKIGLLSFFSAYTIIKNDNGKILGYLNIPYFARQDEMEKELSFFAGALINLYVVLFLLSIFIAIIISRLIAEPLQLIRSRLGDISLGKPNTPIAWDSNDEIGLLINEYNRMIIQLEESAEKLARSERESAWREMARQVAHEIKNPLTPMKLSAQHLQRTWKESPEEFDLRLQKFTQNLIEQIDTLSNIANEFSDFAKMPRPNVQKIDIYKIASQSVEFFKPATKSHIILQKKAESTLVLADKDQMIRVFNNLIKNAIQAIDAEEDGLIEISICREKEMIQVSIRDNGNGIDDDLKEKIFRPNFTTKTSGMGLGLAMVKNIISSHGGNIWFESENQKGTTFFFTLPIVENQDELQTKQ